MLAERAGEESAGGSPQFGTTVEQRTKGLSFSDTRRCLPKALAGPRLLLVTRVDRANVDGLDRRVCRERLVRCVGCRDPCERRARAGVRDLAVIAVACLDGRSRLRRAALATLQSSCGAGPDAPSSAANPAASLASLAATATTFAPAHDRDIVGLDGVQQRASAAPCAGHRVQNKSVACFAHLECASAAQRRSLC